MMGKVRIRVSAGGQGSGEQAGRPGAGSGPDGGSHGRGGRVVVAGRLQPGLTPPLTLTLAKLNPNPDLALT